MDGWDIVMGVVNVIPRLPLEKFFERDRAKDFERLEQSLTNKGLLTEAPAVVQHPSTAAVKPAESPRKPTMPTTQETIEELRRRLGKELYKAELDLAAGLRIAGKPCDCLDQKHSLMLEAAAEEMMSYEQNPVYGQIIDWLRLHQAEFPPGEIAKRTPEHYQRYVPEMRKFRKAVMGTEALSALVTSTEPISLEKAKTLAAKIASEEVERAWHSQETKSSK